MNEIEVYLKKLNKKYNCDINFCTSEMNGEQLEKIPKIMCDFYKIVQEAKLPFGKIFSIERALKESKREPFKPNWYVFGKDNYFSFWLCAYDQDSDGLSFASWDHESGSEIGEATDGDICSFLEYEEYDNVLEKE